MLKKIVLNSGSNVALLFVKIILTFIMAPVLIKNLGDYDYGLWEMLGAVIGYMGMLDLGIKPAIGRFAAKYNAEGDQDSQQLMFSSAFIFMIFVGLLLAATFLTIGLYYPELLSGTESAPFRYSVLCFVLAGQFIFTFPGYVAESVLEGLQQFHLRNMITLVNSLLGSFLIFNLITPQNGLVLLAGINAAGLSSKYVIYFYILSKHKFGQLMPMKARFNWPLLKTLLVFGSKSLIQGIATRLESATDTLIIGAVLGPATVPLYSIPANLVHYIRNIAQNMTQVFMPLFSEQTALGKEDLIIRIYFLGSKIIVAISVLLGIGVILLGADFIGLWIGEKYAGHATPLIIVLVSFTVLPLLNPFASRYLTAINQHGIFAKLMPISAIMNLSLSLLLINNFGILGVAFGSLIPATLFVPIYLNRCCRHLGIKMRDYIFAAVVPSILPAGIMIGLMHTGLKYWDIHSFSDVIGLAVMGSSSFFVSFYFLGLTTVERLQIQQIYRR